MAEWLIEPLKYGFFQRGLLAGMVVAVACGALSAFVVWRGMAFLGDALAHAVLPGIVVSVMLGVHILIGALAAALLSVIGIGAISGQRGFKQDTAVGVIFTGAFALGILLISRIKTFKDLAHILFGNILGVAGFDLFLIAVIGLLVLIMLFLFYKELLVTSFDATHATAIGLSPRMVHYGLLILIAATTVIATQTVGVVLVLALLVTPAATASLLFRELPKIIGSSVVLAVLAVIAGFYASYFINLVSGAAIVLVLIFFFIIAFIFVKIKNGLQSRFYNG